MAIGKVLVSTSKQIMDLWRAGLLKKGIAPAVQDALESSVRARGWTRLAPKEFLQEVNKSHTLNQIPSVMPKIKIQEAGGIVAQRSLRQGRSYHKRLANKASETRNQKLRRLGLKPKKDPSTTDYDK